MSGCPQWAEVVSIKGDKVSGLSPEEAFAMIWFIGAVIFTIFSLLTYWVLPLGAVLLSFIFRKREIRNGVWGYDNGVERVMTLILAALIGWWIWVPILGH